MIYVCYDYQLHSLLRAGWIIHDLPAENRAYSTRFSIPSQQHSVMTYAAFSSLIKLNIGVFRFYLKFLGFTERDLDYIALQILYSTNFIFTARKQSCGKVMFLHLSVSHSVQRGGLFQHTTSRGCVSQHAMGRGMYTHRQTLHCPGQTSPRQTCPWADTSPGQTTPPQTPPGKHPLGRHPS